MAAVWTFLLGGWNKLTIYAVAIGGALLAVLGWRYMIRRGARKEFEAHMREQTYDQIKRTTRAAADAADHPVDEWLRDHDLLRE